MKLYKKINHEVLIFFTTAALAFSAADIVKADNNIDAYYDNNIFNIKCSDRRFLSISIEELNCLLDSNIDNSIVLKIGEDYTIIDKELLLNLKKNAEERKKCENRLAIGTCFVECGIFVIVLFNKFCPDNQKKMIKLSS